MTGVLQGMHVCGSLFESGGHMINVERIIEDLKVISENLNDAAMAVLSEAIENGVSTRPELEKRLSQARRAVDKAVHHLEPATEQFD
jgi:hypothetical protein